LGTLCAAEEADPKLARLGFAFDQRAHEAAVAAANADQESEKHGPGDVIRLPKYFVTEKRLPFTEREIQTPKGRLELAKKTYLSPVYQKTFGPLSNIYALFYNPLGGWHPNDPEAMALYQDADQMRRNQEMEALMRLDALQDKTAGGPAPEESTKR